MNIWDSFIITPMINALLLIYNYIGSFGIAIILFTILIRLITHPLMAKQIKSAQAMQSLTQAKRYKAMQEKYKGQKEKLAQAQMELYKEMGVSPFASCLPTLIQLPIIIGLYQSLMRVMASTPAEMLYLKQHIYDGLLNISTLIPLDATFLWMDLAQPERLFIPGIAFGIPVMAVVVVITSYMQTKLTMPPADPTSQSSMMTNMMNIYMPLLMGYLAYTLSAGLSLYFLVS
ncbi:MAG: membrane protein insertase YidC, partial [Anaerolineaceae bacterium]|nr:membrane protein insertase YidC [Anaerolineaceae bacterium]